MLCSIEVGDVSLHDFSVRITTEYFGIKRVGGVCVVRRGPVYQLLEAAFLSDVRPQPFVESLSQQPDQSQRSRIEARYHLLQYVGIFANNPTKQPVEHIVLDDAVVVAPILIEQVAQNQ